MEIESVATEWDAICRICLQEGEMHSIFDEIIDIDESTTNDSEGLTIANKIMLCSSIEIKQGMSLPEQICTDCLNNLDVALTFRKSCERSDAILQSFIENDLQAEYLNDQSVVVNSDTGTVYKYKPPEGLKIKRVKAEPAGGDGGNVFVKSEPYSDTEIEKEEYEIAPKTLVRKRAPPGRNTQKAQKPNEKLATTYHLVTNDDVQENDADVDDPGVIRYEEDDEEFQPIKIVRTNKVRLGVQKKPTMTSDAEKNASDDSPSKGMRVVRFRKNIKEQKAPKVCEICGNSYKYQHALESHMRRHRNEKPFECSVCGKGFVINFELNRHMRTHTGQKPYACKYCDRRFSDFGSRVKHERTHTGERPYACETCGKTFTYSHVLSSHNLIHTGEKKYHCDICGKRFAKSHHLKAHLNTHAKQSLASKSLDAKFYGQEKEDDGQQVNDANIEEYITITNEPMTGNEDETEDGEQLLLYGDVNVLTMPADGRLMKSEKAQYIEDENGIQHEITIEEQQDAIELLTFEDDQLE